MFLAAWPPLTVRGSAGPGLAQVWHHSRAHWFFFLVHAPHDTPMPTMVAVAGMRWKIEENNEQGKDLIGLDQHQVRTWTAWHHYVTACMFAHAFVVVQRARLISVHSGPDTLDQAPGDDAAAGKITRRCPHTPSPSAPGGWPRPPSPTYAT